MWDCVIHEDDVGAREHEISTVEAIMIGFHEDSKALFNPQGSTVGCFECTAKLSNSLPTP